MPIILVEHCSRDEPGKGASGCAWAFSEKRKPAGNRVLPCTSWMWNRPKERAEKTSSITFASLVEALNCPEATRKFPPVGRVFPKDEPVRLAGSFPYYR